MKSTDETDRTTNVPRGNDLPCVRTSSPARLDFFGEPVRSTPSDASTVA